MGSAPDAVKRLVDLFDRERKVYQSPEYKEEQLRAEFLNPLFTNERGCPFGLGGGELSSILPKSPKRAGHPPGPTSDNRALKLSEKTT
jgi:hypothetical protein